LKLGHRVIVLAASLVIGRRLKAQKSISGIYQGVKCLLPGR